MAQLTCVGYVQTTVTTTAQTLTQLATTIPGGASSVEVVVETAAIRYRQDGTSPTTSVGVPVPAASAFAVEGDISKLRIIAQSGTATLNITFFG